MPFHAETRVLPFAPEQIFDLVADVERYPEFLPWCIATRIIRREGDVIHADMVIGFKMFRERFTSKATLRRPDRIDVEYIKGPLRHLNNHWVFTAANEGRCVVDFHIDFEFRSVLFRRTIGPLFHEASRRMVDAFETRARALYG